MFPNRPPNHDDSSRASLAELAQRLDFIMRTRLWAQVVAAMILGIAVGLLLSPDGGAIVSADTATLIAAWLALPGQLFLAMIQMVVVPLVVSSIVMGLAGGGSVELLKRVGLRIAPYFVVTTTAAVLIGLAVAYWIKPGTYLDLSSLGPTSDAVVAIDVPDAKDSPSIPERIVKVVPSNPSSAILEQAMFQIVVLAVFLAAALASISPEHAKPLLELFASLQEVAMQIVSWAMVLAPLAVFGLLAQVFIQVGLDAILGMAVYVGTVLLGLSALVVLYLLIVWLVARRSPWEFLRKVRDVQLLAFSTSSSAAVMPLSMQTAEEKLGVPNGIARFIVPLGATVNMDGTALYQIIAAIFLTQLYGIELSLAETALLAVTLIGASIGSPSTPGVGIVILATIVNGLGVPPSGIALILGVDRILDMARTTVNVTGDLTACLVMTRWLGESDDSS